MAKVEKEEPATEFKIKMFKTDSHDESHLDIEDTVNEWLADNPQLEIFDIQMQTPNRGVFVMVHYSGEENLVEEEEVVVKKKVVKK